MNRYTDPTILKTKNTNRPYYKAKFYPDIPFSETDEYVITTVGNEV